MINFSSDTPSFPVELFENNKIKPLCTYVCMYVHSLNNINNINNIGDMLCTYVMHI